MIHFLISILALFIVLSGCNNHEDKAETDTFPKTEVGSSKIESAPPISTEFSQTDQNTSAMEAPKKKPSTSNSVSNDNNRERALKKFEGKYWKNTDFFVVYLDLKYLGNSFYKFKLQIDEDCVISKISGDFKLAMDNKGVYYSEYCGNVTFDFNDLFNPEHIDQPVIEISADNESCINCTDGFYFFGDFWKR